MGNPVSKNTVHRYLKQEKGATAYRSTKSPILTEKQRENRLNFCKEKKNWTEEDWKRALWTDEMPFEIFHPTNPQNDRIWARNKSVVPNVQTVKFPPRVMV